MSCIAFYSIAVYNTRCCFTLFLQLFYFYLSMNIFSFNYIATWVICAAQNHAGTFSSRLQLRLQTSITLSGRVGGNFKLIVKVEGSMKIFFLLFQFYFRKHELASI